MAKKKKYIVTHSNYTVKKIHKKLDGDKTVYERDYTVLTNNGGWDSGTIAHGTPTFKMVNFTKPSGTKKHQYGEWLKQDVCVNEKQNGEIWTLDCIPNSDGKSKENVLTINPNYNSLLDFAYFGSCSELIRTTITHIIETFPAELYVTDKKTDAGYIVYNPFEINIINKATPINEDVNELRYFCKSYYKYEIISGGTIMCVDKWDVSDHKNLSCYKNGDKICDISLTDGIVFSAYLENNVIQLYSNTHGIKIRPTEGVIEKFFNELDDFEKILLNRYTNPIYTIQLDYPHETDHGIKTYKKSFTWPISNGYNLEVEDQRFDSYIGDLLKLADFYDSRQTNNLWRAMTHDSIKNMDLTYKKELSNDDINDYNIGTSKIEGLLMAYGRQFDELKRYIDNIKSINNITYDGNNNIPHYLLSDKLELYGWEVNNVSPSIDESNTVTNLYPGDKRVFSSSDANIGFMKALLMNSKNIFSKKGTKRGIEELLSLFGLKSYDFVRLCNEHGMTNSMEYDYKITEYVNVVNNNISLDDVEKFNSWKKTFIVENDESSEDTNYLQGLPVRMVIYGEKNSDGDIVEKNYLIPWFDKVDEKDGNPYFQMYGGWGKTQKKRVNNNGINELISTKENLIYDETIKYIKIVKRLSDLEKVPETVNNGDIYYVMDIDNFDELYNNNENIITLSGVDTLKASNYFILRNKQYYTILGHTEDGIIGWENITENDIKNAKGDGFSVIYLESIIDDYRGNNPHCGYGKYDDGIEYLKYFQKLFKNAIETNNFKELAYDCETGELNPEIEKIGYNGIIDDNGEVIWVKDNMKTWYFTDTNSSYGKIGVMEKKQDKPKMGNSEIYGNKTSASTVSYEDYLISSDQDDIYVGANNGYSTFESELMPYNFEGGELYDEASANSIINNKMISIEFSNKFINSIESYDYLYRCIMPFLKQMIPSTSIFSVNIEGGLAEYTCINNIAQVEGVS